MRRPLVAIALLLIASQIVISTALPKVGSEAPVIRAVTYDGKAVSTTSLKGKVVAVIFVAEWCPHCRKELPALSEAWKKQGLEVEDVVGIVMMVSSGESSALEFFKSVDPPSNWKLVLLGDETAEDFGVAGVPTTVIIDKNWTVAAVFVGETPPEEVLEPIIKLSSAGKPSGNYTKPNSSTISIVIVASVLAITVIAVVFHYGIRKSGKK